MYDTQRSDTAPLAIFTVGSVGRTDLFGEEAKLGLAHELFQSLHARLETLPNSVQVYPGHGAGSLCDTGMSERTGSTLGYERRTNSFFNLTEEAFALSEEPCHQTCCAQQLGFRHCWERNKACSGVAERRFRAPRETAAPRPSASFQRQARR